MSSGKSADETVREHGTYAGPMPPEVSEKAVESAAFELDELACHYGWTDEELEDDLLEIKEYIKAVCVTKEAENR